MRLLLRVVGVIMATVIVVPLLLVLATLVTLNTGGGREFAVREINHFLAGTVQVEGLGGHFPADLKLGHISIVDAKGAWAQASDVELRWRPEELLRRSVHVTVLTAAEISVLRAPAPGKPKKKSGGLNLPRFRLAVDLLRVDVVRVSAALAGQPTVLAVTGTAHLRDLTQGDEAGDVTLDATAADGRGTYHARGAADEKTVGLDLTVAEPPDGLLGYFAGPRVRDPLNLTLSLHGPRDAAALKFAAALGAARMEGNGTLDLDGQAPGADVVLNVPALAPVAAIAGQQVAGATTLHLVIAQRDNRADVAIDGQLALTAAPWAPAVRLVGPQGAFSLRASLAGQTATIQALSINGAGFAVAVSGTASHLGVNLMTHLALNDVAMLAPALAGHVSEDGTVVGPTDDFAVHAVLAGTIRETQVPSGPFNLVVDAAHLPRAPAGTVTGTGELANAKLALAAAFARDAAGNATVTISNATWRSLRLRAALALAAGAKLPTGTAAFAVTQLADFRRFVPLPLAGGIDGDFAHPDGQDFLLHLNANQLVVSPAIGAINGKISANGPTNALAVRLQATVAKLMNAPARLAASATLNLDQRSAVLAAFTASWHGLDAALRGPAAVQTKPDLAVRHLNLALNGGSISLDGVLSPRLDVRAAVSDLPVSLAKLFAPAVDAAGTVSATADLTGRTSAPAGRLTLTARGIALRGGPAAALPAADFTAAATLARSSANIDVALHAGPNVALNADGLAPLSRAGPVDLHLTGVLDLRLLDPILAASGSLVHGVITPDVTVTGTAAAPDVAGSVVLANGTVTNIGTGLSLTGIAAQITAAGRVITLHDVTATAGAGSIGGHGTVDLAAPGIAIDLALNAANASPIASDLLTENLNAALTVKGALNGRLALGGSVTILKANINIPKTLPAGVANLPILNRGAPPPPLPPPAPDIALNLLLRAANQIFIRGDGLFAELGGKLVIGGTAAHPDPEGGFTLIRGSFALGGKTLQFTKGVVSFNGAGFSPTLDLEASTTSGNVTSTLVIGGTAAKPTITLTSSPPLPSDEILANLLFGQGTQNLSAFQAAQLAAALAQLSGIGGGADPLGSVRNALGLDELSLGGSGGAPTVQAGRYVAPGVYVGAQQSATGQGTQATVEINLYKGLKLTTSTGTSATSGGNSSSVGLTYQFNY